MAVSKDDILNAIADMSVMDVVDLVKAMEDKFGVSAQAAVAAVPQPYRAPYRSMYRRDRKRRRCTQRRRVHSRRKYIR